jgi:hypothetical protein
MFWDVHFDYTTSYSHSLISPSQEAVINFDYTRSSAYIQ